MATCLCGSPDVLWSHRLEGFACLRCYLRDAPDVPDDWEPYQPPPAPLPSSRDLALERVRSAMEVIAPVGLTGYGVVGTCPVCRRALYAHVGVHVTVLECDSACPEEAVWTELRRHWGLDAA